MKKKSYMSWDTYFMSIALISSFRSKDPHSQNGACIVDSDNKIIGIGYNGLPRGLDDSDPHYWKKDDDLEFSFHTYVVHAEENAILNSIGKQMEEGRMYITQSPCNKCAQKIIQVGIKKVIHVLREDHNDKHVKLNRAVDKMFKDAGVELIYYYDLDIPDKEFIDKLKNMKEFYN